MSKEERDFQVRIVCAACIVNGVVVAGVRHYDQVMHKQIEAMNGWDSAEESGDRKQGFLDNKGQFHDRQQAFVIAKAAEQIRQKSDYPDSTTLYSEDLY